MAAHRSDKAEIRAEQTRSPEYETRSYTYPRPRPGGAGLKVEESQGGYVRRHVDIDLQAAGLGSMTPSAEANPRDDDDDGVFAFGLCLGSVSFYLLF